MKHDNKDLDKQMKTMLAWRIPESRYKVWREVWQLFLIFFFVAVGFGLFAVGSYWACVSRWPDKTFSECMRYDIETKQIRK